MLFFLGTGYPLAGEITFLQLTRKHWSTPGGMLKIVQSIIHAGEKMAGDIEFPHSVGWYHEGTIVRSGKAAREARPLPGPPVLA